MRNPQKNLKPLIRKRIDVKITGKPSSIRKQLVELFLTEKKGYGKQEFSSKYSYYVDKLSDGQNIVLKRPARLNKGFDFEVHIDGSNFGKKRKSTMPSHKSILKDLRKKKKESLKKFYSLFKIISTIYSCKGIKKEDYTKISFLNGYPSEVILYAIKWLFVEQDVTYWNWSGRNKLFTEIKRIRYGRNYQNF